MTPFQLTAARRRLVGCRCIGDALGRFQLTAARRRLVGEGYFVMQSIGVSTHSRPKAAGCRCGRLNAIPGKFQLTAARRRLAFRRPDGRYLPKFQLTAARRRLELEEARKLAFETVSTHSRPKAAG